VWVRRKDPNRDYAENESREAFEDETSWEGGREEVSGQARGGRKGKKIEKKKMAETRETWAYIQRQPR
jgi:hypothetical protein